MSAATVAPTAKGKRTRLPAIRLVKSSRFAVVASRWLFASLLTLLAGLLFLPWQQNVRGTGRVVAYAPLERQLVVKSAIKGRVVEWMPGIRENAFVEAGASIVRVEDVDPEYERRLQEKVSLAEAKINAAEEIRQTYREQVASYRELRTQLLQAADQLIEVADIELEVAAAGVEAAEADLVLKEANYARKKNLFEKGGLSSQYEFQIAEQEFRLAEAKRKQEKLRQEAAVRRLAEKKAERSAKERDADTKVQEAEAKLRKAESDRLVCESERITAESELNRYQRGRLVTAPRSGFIFKLLANQGGEIVKEGDPLLILVPDTKDRAVELTIDGNDVPWVVAEGSDPAKGSPVRLQFEGYPAVQFAPGWPEVSVGTFGGRVVIVDPTDDGTGQFRTVVLPDPNDVPWPDDRFLRQGVRVNGWILLNRVRLGYELWRRLNGFPPLPPEGTPMKYRDGSKAKPPLPK